MFLRFWLASLRRPLLTWLRRALHFALPHLLLTLHHLFTLTLLGLHLLLALHRLFTRPLLLCLLRADTLLLGLLCVLALLRLLLPLDLL